MTDRVLMMAKVSRPLPQPLFSLVPTVSGVGVSAGEKPQRSTQWVVHGRANSSEGARVHAMLDGLKVRNWSDPCGRRALTAWRRLRDCTLVFVQRGRISFHQKAPPPVERVESIMTSLAGSLGRNASRSAARTDHVSCILPGPL